MATHILDAFLIKFGIETSEFEDGERDIRDRSKRLREDSKKTFDGMEAGSKKFGSSIKNVRNEVVGLGLAFMGARSITDMIGNMMTGAASAERLGNTMGMTTRQVWSWRQAMKGVGGQTGDADAALQSIQRLRMAFQMGQIDPASSGILSRLGVSGNDLRNGNPGDIMRKLSGAQSRMDPEIFSSLLSQIGLSGPVTYFLMKGQSSVEQLLDKYEESADQQEELAQKTEDLQQKMAELNTSIQGKLVPVLVRVADGLEKILSILPGGGDAKTRPSSEGRKVLWEDKVFGGLFTIYADKAPKPGGQNLAQSRGQAPVGALNSGNEAQIKQFLTNKGVGSARTLGIMGALFAESKMDPKAINPTSGAFGINQWLGSRKAELGRRYGVDKNGNPTANLQQQLEFLWWELNGGDHGGKAVLRQNTAAGTARTMIEKFLRPAKGYETTSDLRRAQNYMSSRGGGNITIQNMTVQTKDAASFQRDMRAQVRRHTVAKADQGVAP